MATGLSGFIFRVSHCMLSSGAMTVRRASIIASIMKRTIENQRNFGLR